jgi:CTP synthase (UTP-ammonia lyase)
MGSALAIGLIGDYDAKVKAHVAIPKALELAARVADCDVEPVWIPTASLDDGVEMLGGLGAIWCVPGSPYASMEGAIRAIGFARRNRRAFLGTCGGFQHAILEYARNVLGLDQADHAETSPDAEMPLISRLSCSLVGQRGTISLNPSSQAAKIYGRTEIEEEYNCNFGVNPQLQPLLEKAELKISGTDAEGQARVVELHGHPFYLATLFQPERSAFRGVPHPLIAAFLQVAKNGSA